MIQATFTAPQVRIRKAKITKERTLEFSFVETHEDGGYFEDFRSGNYLVHDDIIQAFKKLVPHMIALCDMREVRTDKKNNLLEPESYNMEELSHISVKSFSIGGSGDQEGVVLVGTKEAGGKFINIITPFVKWEDEYPYSEELLQAISDCNLEVIAYMKGKRLKKQLEMDFDQIEEAEEVRDGN